MANQAQFLLQVSDYTLSGIDRTNRTIRVRGNAIPVIVPGSVNTVTVVAGGSGWVVGDLFTLAKAPGAIFKVATVSSGAIATATVVNPGPGGATATTGDTATAIAPSVGVSATLTSTVNTGAGGLLIITGFSIASSVVTFNVANALTTGGGQTVIVQGFTGAYSFLNGSYTTSTATATTVTASITAPNVGQTSVYATMTVQPTYVTGGVIIQRGFVDQLGLPRPIAGIGPNANPTRLLLETKNDSTLAYSTQVVQTNIGWGARVFNWASTAGEVAAGALPADVVGFLAEFSAGAF